MPASNPPAFTINCLLAALPVELAAAALLIDEPVWKAWAVTVALVMEATEPEVEVEVEVDMMLD
jgi:hypothetical protein